MDRLALQYVASWKERATRKPLIVRGARQVGKSHLVRMLAEETFDDLLEIDVETGADVASLFASRTPSTIVPLLEARFGRPLRPGKTLLFLDEIQAAPELLASLRYFHEQMPELHVIAAGSLLDFALADQGFSMPVGRIEYLHLGPMSFEEYLLAAKKESLLSFVRSFSVGENVPEAIHLELMRLVRQFMVVGGMPASIQAFVGSGDYHESDAVRQGVLSTYRDDFNKYARHVDRWRLGRLFEQIPMLVGSKLMYSRVDRNTRARDMARVLDMLCMARVCHRVRHSSANGVPLGAGASDRHFKVLFMDVGLLCRSCGLGLSDLESAEDPILVNAGAVCEQFVGQHLLHSGKLYEEPSLRCWIRSKRQSNAEVDYVISLGQTIVPVEVKAGKTGSLKSLHLFLREKDRDFGLRFCSDVPSLLQARTSLADGNNRPFRLLSLPFYMIGQARRLCREGLDRGSC